MVVITLSLGVVQEMCARMGAVTGKGLSALIREHFGIRLVAFAMLTMLIANGGTAVSEFVGIGAALGLVGIPAIVGVPAMAVLIWALVARGSYRRVEIIFLLMTLAFFAYPISTFMAHPNWGQVARQTVVPSFQLNAAYIFTFVATVGTTITPYMQVYLQSSTGAPSTGWPGSPSWPSPDSPYSWSSPRCCPLWASTCSVSSRGNLARRWV